jgi:peptidoglycan biosynthesis protein MviN/MurJ (putative lipid II flippase)
MRRRIKRLNGRDIFNSFIRITLASAIMSAVSYFTYRLLTDYFVVKTLVIKLIEAFVPIGVGGSAFVVAAKLLGVTELEKLYGMLRRKLKRG